MLKKFHSIHVAVIMIVLSFFANALGISRLTEDMIRQKKVDFEAMQIKDAARRPWIKAGCYCAGTAVAIGSLYTYYQGEKLRPREAVSFEELRCQVESLREMLNGPRFGSVTWFKTALFSFFVSPFFIVNVAENFAQKGFDFLQSVFYIATLKWYLQQKTNLGDIRISSEPGAIRKHLAHGVLVQELMHHAAILGKDAKSIVSIDCEYHKKRILALMDQLVDEMAGLIAFFKYKADLWNAGSDSENRLGCCIQYGLEASERSRYLFNYTNNLCDSVEKSLALPSDCDDQQVTSVLTLLKSFFAELEQVLVSFSRIEQEVSA